MRVVVTGGHGFIGRRLVVALIADGHDVTVLSRRSDADLPGLRGVVRGDLTAADCPVQTLVDDCDILFHCAGEIRDEARMRPLHVEGTRRLLTAAEAAARRRAIHWVQLSSVGVYGPPDGPAHLDRTVTEVTPLRPRGEYEVTKAESDLLVERACARSPMSCTILRPSNVFGTGMPNPSLRHLAGAVRRGLFFYVGRPGAVATYVHVDDVVDALRRCGSDQRAKGRTFNLSNDCFIEDAIDGLARACGVNSPRRRLPERLVRGTAAAVGRVVSLPLTRQGIDALVARTRFPPVLLERELGFTPQRAVPATIGEALIV